MGSSCDFSGFRLCSLVILGVSLEGRKMGKARRGLLFALNS